MQPYAGILLSEDWIHDRLGFDFSEDFWTDSVRRTENYRQISYETARKHPGIGVGSLDAKPVPKASDQYSHRFMPALFGCEIVYTKNQAPAALPLAMEAEDLYAVTAPDFSASEVIRKALDDAAVLRRKYGFVRGAINMGSPLNVAVTVYGEAFLAACALEPDAARHVLRVIAETEIKLIHEFCAIVEPDYPTNPLPFSIGNCPAIMFSPALYREVVLPTDLWLRKQSGRFGIHHCGVFDKYNEVYRELTPDSLDVGAFSDYRLLRSFFPDTTCSYIVDNGQIEGRTRDEIDETVRRIITQGGPPEHISTLRAYGLSKHATDDNLADFHASAVRQGLVSTLI